MSARLFIVGLPLGQHRDAIVAPRSSRHSVRVAGKRIYAGRCMQGDRWRVIETWAKSSSGVGVDRRCPSPGCVQRIDRGAGSGSCGSQGGFPPESSSDSSLEIWESKYRAIACNMEEASLAGARGTVSNCSPISESEKLYEARELSIRSSTACRCFF